jgi:hypothetical protein
VDGGNERPHDTDLLDTLSQRVMLGDRAMGTADAVVVKYVRLQSG